MSARLDTLREHMKEHSEKEQNNETQETNKQISTNPQKKNVADKKKIKQIRHTYKTKTKQILKKYIF